MPKATVTRPFVWRAGHTNVLVEKGEQELTPEQLAYAEEQGFVQKPVTAKKKDKAGEVSNDE